MGFFNFLKKRQKNINNDKLSVSGGKIAVEWVKETNMIPLAYEQYQNYYWYKGDADYLGWFYTRGIYDLGLQSIMTQQFRTNYQTYFWTTAYKEKKVKRTHSGLPKLIVDTLVNCLGVYQFKEIKGDEINEAKTKRLDEILKDNNFKTTFKKQITMDLVIGDGAYIINIDSKVSDSPLIEYVDGRDCSFEYRNDKIIAVVINKNYVYDNRLYECYERRSTKRVYDEETKQYKTIATIEYKLFSKNGNKSWSECKLTDIPQTENLKNLEYPNIPFMLAIPCVRDMNIETKRGNSIFKGCIDLFDDLDQSLSMESNTLRASTPVEYLDENSLEHDKDGNAIEPSVYGKQFILYKGSGGYSEASKGITTVFYNVDFSKLSYVSHELINKCCSITKVAPASLGIDVARNDNALAQREKEKATFQTLKDMQSYEIPVLTDLFKMVLVVDEIMVNENAIPSESNIQVVFSDYGTPTRNERINIFSKPYLDGALSLDRYIQEVYFDEDKESQEKEKEALLREKTTDKFNFNFSEDE